MAEEVRAVRATWVAAVRVTVAAENKAEAEVAIQAEVMMAAAA